MERYRVRTWLEMIVGESDRPAVLRIAKVLTNIGNSFLILAIIEAIRGNQRNLWVIALIAVILYLISLVLTSFQIEEKAKEVTLKETNEVEKKQILVTTLSTYTPPKHGNPDNLVLRTLIELHRPTLKEIHILSVLAQDEDGTVYVSGDNQDKNRRGVWDSYDQLQKEKLLNGLEVKFHKIADTNRADDTFYVANQLFNQFSPSQLKHVVADVTSGQKPMTVALSKSALDHGCDVSYIVTPRNREGFPEPGEAYSAVVHVSPESEN